MSGASTPSESEALDRREDFLVVGLVAGVLQDLAIANNPIGVEDEHGSPGDPMQADHVLVVDPVVLNHLLVEIAQEREREPLCVMESLQREERIDADAVDLGLRFIEARELVAKRAQLLLADR